MISTISTIITVLLSILYLNSASGKTFTLMTYNIENMFDTTHDEGKKDWTWLPLSFKNQSQEVQDYCYSIEQDHYRRECLELDWNQGILAKKMKNLANVFESISKRKMPDVVVFQEVENKKVLRTFMMKHLFKYGFKYVSLIEGDDERGIDIGMISKFPIISEKTHKVDIRNYSKRPTRPILEVDFKVNDKVVTVFGNHWPSQGNVDHARLVASRVLKRAAHRKKTDLIIATGDFNTLKDDSPHGININVLPHFEDVEVKGRIYSNVKPDGTHWYRGKWSSIDRIFVLKKSMRKNGAKVRIEYNKFSILNFKFMLRDLEWTDFDTGTTYLDKDIPYRFNKRTGEGYSDHLPVSIRFELN